VEGAAPPKATLLASSLGVLLVAALRKPEPLVTRLAENPELLKLAAQLHVQLLERITAPARARLLAANPRLTYAGA
jgi:hypothetical protein